MSLQRPYARESGRFVYGDKRPIDTALLDAWDELHPDEPMTLGDELRELHAHGKQPIGGEWAAFNRGLYR